MESERTGPAAYYPPSPIRPPPPLSSFVGLWLFVIIRIWKSSWGKLHFGCNFSFPPPSCCRRKPVPMKSRIKWQLESIVDVQRYGPFVVEPSKSTLRAFIDQLKNGPNFQSRQLLSYSSLKWQRNGQLAPEPNRSRSTRGSSALYIQMDNKSGHVVLCVVRYGKGIESGDYIFDDSERCSSKLPSILPASLAFICSLSYCLSSSCFVG